MFSKMGKRKSISERKAKARKDEVLDFIQGGFRRPSRRKRV